MPQVQRGWVSTICGVIGRCTASVTLSVAFPALSQIVIRDRVRSALGLCASLFVGASLFCLLPNSQRFDYRTILDWFNYPSPRYRSYFRPSPRRVSG
ncbi:hypothetical protein PGT21_036957 [Puccinia graminis f. sp. tritici]|uniref:Uncharacterized protein n=1 Tax=Puccinia graminis f. sp. tritici TaxID=56615 RepID=A0A5B0QQI9_PUCGR|nr:hypothetical protein PGT21_036957 [Puccinia graminis f. sp. tritici]